jgi:hypothetical protein
MRTVWEVSNNGIRLGFANDLRAHTPRLDRGYTARLGAQLHLAPARQAPPLTGRLATASAQRPRSRSRSGPRQERVASSATGTTANVLCMEPDDGLPPLRVEPQSHMRLPGRGLVELDEVAKGHRKSIDCIKGIKA